MSSIVNFNSLVQQIEYTDRALQTNARLVINRHVTARAWLTGYAIGQSPTDQLVLTENQTIKKSQSLTDQFILPTTIHEESPVLVDSFSIFNKRWQNTL